MTDDLVTVQARIIAAGASVEGVRGYSDPAAQFAPPALLVSPPRLTWTTDGLAPQAQFLAFLMVKVDDRAIETLLRLLPLVAEAIDDVPDAVVREAFPAVWRTGTTELPSYEIQIEVSLR